MTLIQKIFAYIIYIIWKLAKLLIYVIWALLKILITLPKLIYKFIMFLKGVKVVDDYTVVKDEPKLLK